MPLQDWQLQNPGSQVVQTLPDPSPVELRPDPYDPTVQVYDLNGVKLGHVVKAVLNECMKRYTYIGVFYRKGSIPWIRAIRS